MPFVYISSFGEVKHAKKKKIGAIFISKYYRIQSDIITLHNILIWKCVNKCNVLSIDFL